jgi:hypothetical protein
VETVAGFGGMHVGCLRPLLGLLIGAICGGALALAVGDPIGKALGYSDFEGQRSYVVVFALMPLFLLAGAFAGLLVAVLTRRGS